MKVVLVSLMLLLAFIAIDCSPLEKAKRDVPDEVDEIYRKYLNWKVEQPQDSDKSFQRFLESTATKIEERNLGGNVANPAERSFLPCWCCGQRYCPCKLSCDIYRG